MGALRKCSSVQRKIENQNMHLREAERSFERLQREKKCCREIKHLWQHRNQIRVKGTWGRAKIHWRMNSVQIFITTHESTYFRNVRIHVEGFFIGCEELTMRIQLFLSGALYPLLSNIPWTPDSIPTRCWHGSGSGDEDTAARSVRRTSITECTCALAEVHQYMAHSVTRYPYSPTVAALSHSESGQKRERTHGKTADTPHQSIHADGFDNGLSNCLAVQLWCTFYISGYWPIYP